ncbi:hypothetical protein B0H63DRAFT_459634 [Podospora didyma]|uniref:BTB domain transcription factor n=1 Tax=Podospora didyma TaxID=330526 RepID=A0AAE0P6P1_9PEZI|nr:hypothetical protein B0H63DRAFT_459634 [Podospora didyma]
MTTTEDLAKGQNEPAAAGSKHTTERDDAPEAKRVKKLDEKEQKTIEETLGKVSEPSKTKAEAPLKTEESKEMEGKKETQEPEETKQTQADKAKEEPQPTDLATAVEPREESVPSSILEKGIIYFFIRGRVGIDDPSSVDDIARSYMLLRPIPTDAKLGSGPIGDAGNSRVCAVPKKVLPQSGKDRWISFVEMAGASFQELKDQFLSSTDYTTKTAGDRHTPAATPIGEGVYAITTTGRESHLAYILTLPEELGEVQKKMGLKEKGSFILSTKNPAYPGPAYARLPKGPEYSKEIQEEFHSLRWLPTQPKHLDFVNTQFLLVGESSGIDKALETQEEDGKTEAEDPAKEMEKLEDEDARRMKDLSSDDASRIFADLQVHAKDYPKLQTTF